MQVVLAFLSCDAPSRARYLDTIEEIERLALEDPEAALRRQLALLQRRAGEVLSAAASRGYQGGLGPRTTAEL